jgi:hypothetical protein
MRRDKPTHWHVDQLTGAGTVVGAWVFPDRGECEVNDELADWPTPIVGFGSSDCGRSAGLICVSGRRMCVGRDNGAARRGAPRNDPPRPDVRRENSDFTANFNRM